MRFNYERVEVTGYKRGPCEVCRKTAERQATFGQTLNPFNKNQDGSVKARTEIYAEVREELRAWHEAPVRHARCEAVS